MTVQLTFLEWLFWSGGCDTALRGEPGSGLGLALGACLGEAGTTTGGSSSSADRVASSSEVAAEPCEDVEPPAIPPVPWNDAERRMEFSGLDIQL